MNGVFSLLKNRYYRSAARAEQYIDMFKCPLCGLPLFLVEHRSMVCRQRHTFDFSKQGYIHFLTKPAKVKYDQALFTARREMIAAQGLYAPMTALIRELLVSHLLQPTTGSGSPGSAARLGFSTSPLRILDAGAGEGSHLAQITADLPAQGFGLDIAKAGIAMAAAHYEGPIWMVGDLAQAPFADHSFDAIINLLSPASYGEFARLLRDGGIVIKVVPGDDYLIELRELLLPDRKQAYSPARTTARFREQLRLVEAIPLRYTRTLDSNAVSGLLHMTPLGWHRTPTAYNWEGLPRLAITVELLVLVGKLP